MVAGYGTEILAPRWSDGLVRVLLEAARRRARKLDLEMHYRRKARDGQSAWELWVDGNGFAIGAWSRQLERDLPNVAEGFEAIPAARARRIAESLVARWFDWCVGDGAKGDRLRTTVQDPVTWIWPTIEYVEDDQLTPRLVIADELVARWITEEVPEEIVIEELHTAAEAVLRGVLQAGRRVNWPTLLDRARARGILGQEARNNLERFNREYRNRLKHLGRALDDDEREGVRQMIWDVLYALDQLLEGYRAQEA
jgi:hypothetical protein